MMASRSEWGPVQAGSVDRHGVAGLVDSTLAVIAGLPGGIDVGAAGGGLALGRIDGINLALGRPSTRAAVTDGDLGTSWDPPTNAINQFASVDLQSRPAISRVRVLTRGSTDAQLEGNSLRGYSVQVSDDQIAWSEVAVLRDITQYAWSEVAFRPLATSYVRVVVVEIDPITSPRVAELKVLGSGYREHGQLVSPIIQPQDGGGSVNFGQVRWEATIPPDTEVCLQFRSGRSPAVFAAPEQGWGDTPAGGGFWFPAAEPAALFQYRVLLATQNSQVSPGHVSLRFTILPHGGV